MENQWLWNLCSKWSICIPLLHHKAQRTLGRGNEENGEALRRTAAKVCLWSSHPAHEFTITVWLWLPAKALHRLQPLPFHYNGGGAYEAPPLAEELWGVFGFGLFFFFKGETKVGGRLVGKDGCHRSGREKDGRWEGESSTNSAYAYMNLSKNKIKYRHNTHY